MSKIVGRAHFNSFCFFNIERKDAVKTLANYYLTVEPKWLSLCTGTIFEYVYTRQTDRKPDFSPRGDNDGLTPYLLVTMVS